MVHGLPFLQLCFWSSRFGRKRQAKKNTREQLIGSEPLGVIINYTLLVRSCCENKNSQGKTFANSCRELTKVSSVLLDKKVSAHLQDIITLI